MTATTTPDVPGGYRNGAHALTALAELAIIRAAATEARRRLDRALMTIEETLRQADMDHAKALDAVAHFAEHDPASLGMPAHEGIAADALAVKECLTAIEQDVREVLRRAEEWHSNG